jgi:Putative DNA-binding domain
MWPLSEMQQRLRDAVVFGDASRVADLLIGGAQPEGRLAIHQRHYHASLESALLTKFQATGWLVGTSFLQEAIRNFIRRHAPHAPCMAEYGDNFPQFIATQRGAERVPYLLAFAELEWRLGQAAIAVDEPTIGLDALSQLAPENLQDATLRLQPGIHYLSAAWPIDDSIKLYLMETKPDQYPLAPAEVCIEVRGSRGTFQIDRLEATEFTFRRAIQGGRSIGDAAADALDLDAGFDPGRALVCLVNQGHVTRVTFGNTEIRA